MRIVLVIDNLIIYSLDSHPKSTIGCKDIVTGNTVWEKQFDGWIINLTNNKSRIIYMTSAGELGSLSASNGGMIASRRFKIANYYLNVVEEGYVIVTVENTAGVNVYCLDDLTFRPIWSKDFFSIAKGMKSGAAIMNNNIYFCPQIPLTGGNDYTLRLTCIGIKDDFEKWTKYMPFTRLTSVTAEFGKIAVSGYDVDPTINQRPIKSSNILFFNEKGDEVFNNQYTDKTGPVTITNDSLSFVTVSPASGKTKLVKLSHKGDLVWEITFGIGELNLGIQPTVTKEQIFIMGSENQIKIVSLANGDMLFDQHALDKMKNLYNPMTEMIVTQGFVLVYGVDLKLYKSQLFLLRNEFVK